MGMTRQSVSKHLDVLEAAGLVATLRRGREKLHHLNAAPINDIAERWMNHYDRTRAEALSDLKTALEATPMDPTTFVYTTYINATPERVWPGPHRPGLHHTLLWRHPLIAERGDLPLGLEEGLDLRRGLRRVRLVVSDPEQLILESDPYRRLTYAWHTFTPEWAARHGFEEATAAAWRAEPRSKVTFEIEETARAIVKLTVVHDGFEPGGAVLKGVTRDGRPSWPA